MKNYSIAGSKGGSASGLDPGTPLEQLTSSYHSIEGRIQTELNDLCNTVSSYILNCLNLVSIIYI